MGAESTTFGWWVASGRGCRERLWCIECDQSATFRQAAEPISHILIILSLWVLSFIFVWELSRLLSESLTFYTTPLQAVVGVPRVKCEETLVWTGFEPHLLDLIYKYRWFDMVNPGQESLCDIPDVERSFNPRCWPLTRADIFRTCIPLTCPNSLKPIS